MIYATHVPDTYQCYMNHHDIEGILLKFFEEFDDMTHVGCGGKDSPCGTMKSDVKKFLRSELTALIDAQIAEVEAEKLVGGGAWGKGFQEGLDTAIRILQSYKSKLGKSSH